MGDPRLGIRQEGPGLMAQRLGRVSGIPDAQNPGKAEVVNP